jgi:hypothetical protein
MTTADLFYIKRIIHADENGDGKNMYEISLYENEKYKFPWRGWSSEFLEPFEDPTHYTYCNGDINTDITDIYGLLCPDEWKWVGQWRLNTSYTTTGNEGWCYGTSFPRIVQKLIDNQSSSKDTLFQVCRRRRWFRMLQKNPVIEETSVTTTIPLESISGIS